MISARALNSSVSVRGMFVIAIATLAIQLTWLSTPTYAAWADKKVDGKVASDTITGSWYDHKTGNYNNPALSPNYDNDLRFMAESAAPATDNNWLIDLFRSIGEFFKSLFRVLIDVIGYVGIILLILLIIWAIYYASGIYIRTYRPLERNNNSKTAVIDVTRIEELPFEQMQNTTDPLGVCRQLAREGKFDEAILYLYGYKLLALDHARKIHLHKGKTNRMYLRELNSEPKLYELLEPTVQKFELVYFGKHSLTKQSFLEVWKLLEPFHQLLAQVNGSANPNSNANATVATGGGA